MSFPHVLLPYLWIDVDAHTIPWKAALIKAEKRLHGPFKRRGALDTYGGSPKTRVPHNKRGQIPLGGPPHPVIVV